jgi:hypothetical protein
LIQTFSGRHAHAEVKGDRSSVSPLWNPFVNVPRYKPKASREPPLERPRREVEAEARKRDANILKIVTLKKDKMFSGPDFLRDGWPGRLPKAESVMH